MSIRRGVGVRAWSALGALVFAIGLAASGCGDDGDDDEPSRPGEVGGSGGEGGEPGGGSNRPPQKLVILHTNDLHSHLMGHAPEGDYTPATTNDDATRGGAARLTSAIAGARARARSADAEVLLLDAGDFMMGTLFELLATEQASELSLFQTLGYDAITLGNHEFDWTPAGLAAILAAGSERGVSVPIVSSNMKFSVTDRADDGLEALAVSGVIRQKLVKQVGTLKVGLFGLLGENAAQVTPQAAPLTFEPILDASARMVTELRETDGVDLVIALSHSGISAEGVGEDAKLAAGVPGIDVIVSGHTHDSLEEPVRVGNTWIVTAGSYGRYLGELELTIAPAARAGTPPETELEDYTLLEIDDSIEGDAEMQRTVDAYIDDIDATLESAGLSYRQIVATTPADLELPAYAEAPLGNLVADAYRTIAAALEPEDPPAIGADANGQLRAPLIRGETGEVWLADLFRILPTGIGPDQKPGFPLVSFYLNASDIRSGLELGAGKNVVSNDFFLQISGLKVEYDMTKPLFGRVASLALVTERGEEALDPTDTDTCYKIVTTSYVAGLLGVVKALTVGLLAVEAKDSDCETLVDPTTRFIDADPTTRQVEELKQWQALLRFVANLPDTDGDQLPNVPELYVSPQGRIVER